MMFIYNFNIYEDYPQGEFKFLDRYYIAASNKDEAKQCAVEWAKQTYNDRNVSVMSTN